MAVRPAAIARGSLSLITMDLVESKRESEECTAEVNGKGSDCADWATAFSGEALDDSFVSFSLFGNLSFSCCLPRV